MSDKRAKAKYVRKKRLDQKTQLELCTMMYSMDPQFNIDDFDAISKYIKEKLRFGNSTSVYLEVVGVEYDVIACLIPNTISIYNKFMKTNLKRYKFNHSDLIIAYESGEIGKPLRMKYSDPNDLSNPLFNSNQVKFVTSDETISATLYYLSYTRILKDMLAGKLR